MGTLITSAAGNTARMPRSMASATPSAETLPLKESGATMMRMGPPHTQMLHSKTKSNRQCADAHWRSSARGSGNEPREQEGEAPGHEGQQDRVGDRVPVSYTHLTLPTKRIV